MVRLQGESIGLKNRLAQAIGALPDDLSAVPSDFKALAEAVMREASQTSDKAAQIQSDLSRERLLSYQDSDDFEDERDRAQAKLNNYGVGG